MKKLLRVMLVMVMTVMLTACGGNDKKAVTFEEALVKENVLTVAISPDYPPYESINTNKEMVGFDIDMMNELAKYLGTPDQPFTIEWVQMDFDSIIGAIKGKQVDLGVAGFSYDEKRIVEWSEPYYKSEQVIVVNSNSTLKTVDDLKGKTIGVQLGTTGEGAAKEIEGADVVSIKDAQMLFQNLMANQYDAIVVDGAVAINYVKKNNLVVFDEPLLDEENYIIACKGNTVVMDKVSEAIKEFKASEVYDELVQKWMAE